MEHGTWLMRLLTKRCVYFFSAEFPEFLFSSLLRFSLRNYVTKRKEKNLEHLICCSIITPQNYHQTKPLPSTTYQFTFFSKNYTYTPLFSPSTTTSLPVLWLIILDSQKTKQKTSIVITTVSIYYNYTTKPLYNKNQK